MSHPHVSCRSLFTRFARQEDGIALVLALVVMFVLVIAATTAAQLVTSNETNSGRERQAASAFNGGESGLDQAANWVVTNDAGSVLGAGTYTLPSPAPSTVGNDTVALTATKSVVGSAAQWTLTSTTTSPNGKVTKVLQEKMQSETIPGAPAPFWGYGLVMGGIPNPNGYTPSQICDGGRGNDTPTVFGGSGEVTVAVWIQGDVCTYGGEHPIGNQQAASPITVHIGGFLYGSNGPNEIVGSSTSPGPVAAFEALGGCWDAHYQGGNRPFSGCDTYGNGGATNGTKDGVFASSWGPIAQTVTPPTLSAADELALYNSASPGPMHPCGAGSTGTIPATLFDSAGSTTPDTSLGSKNFITLLGSNAFDCKTTSGELTWTPPANHGSKACLHVRGTVFFDASLTMGGADYIQIDTNGVNGCTGAAYPDGASNGSIYIDGTLTLTSDASICSHQDFNSAGTACTIPTTGATIPSVFFSVYNRANAVPAFSMPGNSKFESSAYARGQYSLTNGGSASSVGGSIFANYASITGGSSFSVTNVIPNGSIGSATTTTIWTVIPGSWRQCVLSGCT